MVVNKIYEPSYISLESALAYYQIIPESVLGVTSINSRKTSQFQSTWGVFSYRSIKPQYMIGYQVMEIAPGKKFKMASLEKAIFDYLYLNSDIQSTADFEGLRWNRTQLTSLLDQATFSRFARIFDKQSL
jgi:predicted transcriptional regulator of viral defense system